MCSSLFFSAATSGERLVRDDHPVVLLVTLPQPLQDLDRLVHGRWIDDHGLEPPLERAVLLYILAVLVERGGADALQLTAGERRLQHVRRVDCTFRGPRPHQRVELVDEQDDVAVLGDLVDDRLEPLLELAAVLGAGDHRRHVERQHPVILERVGALPTRDQLSEPLDDRRLPHARFADQHRIVLLAARQDLHHALDLFLPPDRGIELTFGRQLGEIAAEVIERRGLRLLLALGARGLRARAGRRRARRHLAAEQPQRLGARLLQVDARVGQHLRGDPLLLPQQTEQQMLRPHVGVVQLARLAHGELENFFGPGRVRQIGSGGGGRFALLHRLLDLLLNLLEVDVEIRQHGRGNAFAFADQSQQDMLGPHVLVVQPRSFLPRHLEDLAHPIREVVPVHRSPTSDCFGLEHAAHRRRAHRRQLRIAAVTTFERRKVRGLGEYQQLVECVYTQPRWSSSSSSDFPKVVWLDN